MNIKFKHGELSYGDGCCYLSFGRKRVEQYGTGEMVYNDVVKLYPWSLERLKKFGDMTHLGLNVTNTNDKVIIKRTLFGGIKVKGPYENVRFSKKEFNVIKRKLEKAEFSFGYVLPADIEMELISHGINPYF